MTALVRLGGVASVLLILAGCTSGPSPHDKGVADAQAALAAGTLTIKDYPPPPAPAYYALYINLLRDHGIAYEAPSLPKGVSDADFREEVRGWNETMEAAINSKFGAGTLAKLRTEAEKLWQEKNIPNKGP